MLFLIRLVGLVSIPCLQQASPNGGLQTQFLNVTQTRNTKRQTFHLSVAGQIYQTHEPIY